MDAHTKNVVRFHARIANSAPGDVHRDFSGVYFPTFRSMALNEVKLQGKNVVLVPVFPEQRYKRPDGEDYVVEDFVVGNKLQLGASRIQRDNGVPKPFVITSVDLSNLSAANPSTQPLDSTLRDTMKSQTAVFQTIRTKIQARSNAKDIVRGLGKHFRILDDSGDRKLDKAELQKAFDMYGLDLSPEEVAEIMDAMDTDDDGQVSYDEFLLAVRGEMSEERKSCVAKAFRKMDYNKNGCITVDDLQGFYNTAYHPKVQEGEMTEDEVLEKFLTKFDGNGNGIVTYDEFEDYYNAVSASIADDEYFVFMMQRCYNLDNKNVATKRVPAFH